MSGRIRAKFIFLDMGHIEVLLTDMTQQHMLIPGLPWIEPPRNSEWSVDLPCWLLVFACLL